jgi:hypothetical protein
MSQPDFANLPLREIYARLTPDQLAALAHQFQQGLQHSDHPEAQRLVQIAPHTATAEQVAQMHEHMAEHHAGWLGLVMAHPVANSALGAFAAHEVEKHLGTPEGDETSE